MLTLLSPLAAGTGAAAMRIIGRAAKGWGSSAALSLTWRIGPSLNPATAVQVCASPCGSRRKTRRCF
jgi:hypothetical protein